MSDSPADRICSACKHRLPVKGGRYKIINKGLNRRWLCKVCSLGDLKREIRRLEKEL